MRRQGQYWQTCFSKDKCEQVLDDKKTNPTNLSLSFPPLFFPLPLATGAQFSFWFAVI